MIMSTNKDLVQLIRKVFDNFIIQTNLEGFNLRNAEGDYNEYMYLYEKIQ